MARGITLEDAARYGLEYIPISEETGKQVSNELAVWQGRLIFPLTALDDDVTFAGRTLELWQEGMTPAQHKAAIKAHNAALSEKDAKRITRVLKTSPCGHFGCREASQARELVIVEGEFDALSLRIAGIENVIAMGTGFSVDLIPFHVESVTLAMDADTPGKSAAKQLAHNLACAGLDTRQVIPTSGKDWNDMYREGQGDNIRVLFAPPELDQVQAATPATGEIEACADCGVPLTDDTRDFFYSDTGTLYCSVCRDLETSEPHQAEPVEKELTREEIAERFASAFLTWHVELVPTREAYKPAARPERPEQAHNLADYWKGMIA